MINIFLNSYDSWDSEINFLDSTECINATLPDYYDKLNISFYTCDINVNRLTDNPIFKCDPWLLFVKYSLNRKYFECNYEVDSEDKIKKFVSLNFNIDSNHIHKRSLLNFIADNNIDCYYSNISKNITLTEIPEYYPNGYLKSDWQYGVPKEYFLALIDIVTEGSFNMSTHFSEKSFKALYYKKPFISLAGPYWYETFKKYGFELYDELFDYGFDIDEDENTRLDDILLQIKQINSLEYNDLNSIIKNIEPKIEHNHYHLFSLESKILENSYLNNIKIKI